MSEVLTWTVNQYLLLGITLAVFGFVGFRRGVNRELLSMVGIGLGMMIAGSSGPALQPQVNQLYRMLRFAVGGGLSSSDPTAAWAVASKLPPIIATTAETQTLSLFVFIIVVIVAALIVAGVYLGKSRGSVGGAFKLGVIAPLTGDFGAVGENVVKGIKTAQAVHAEKSGNKVDITVENDNASAATGLSAFNKLTQVDHVDGLINTFTSTMDAIYQPGKSLGYPVMMEFLQANNVADDYVFQMTLGNEHVWDRYAKYISQSDYDQSKVAVVHSIDAAQASFAKYFDEAYDKPVTDFVISTDKNELRTDAAKIAALKPTLIVFFMTPENGAIMTKEILPLISSSTQLAYDIQLTTGMSYYQQQLGGDLTKINGAIALMFEGDQMSPEYKQFLAGYQKLYPGEQPGFLADYGYDSFLTYMDTYDEDNAKWIQNLKRFSGKGASGDIMFDENGIRISPLVIKKVSNGQLQTTNRLPF